MYYCWLRDCCYFFFLDVDLGFDVRFFFIVFFFVGFVFLLYVLILIIWIVFLGEDVCFVCKFILFLDFFGFIFFIGVFFCFLYCITFFIRRGFFLCK